MSNKVRKKTVSRKKAAPAASAAATSGPGRTRIWVIRGLAVVGLAVVVGFFLGTEPGGRAEEPEGVTSYTVTRQHTSGTVVYDPEPPVGGDHAEIWLNCGYYSTPVANENATHSLEHGVVWITYRPDLDEGSIDKLRGFARQDKVLVSPYPGLQSEVAVSAWERQLIPDSVDDDRIEQFIRAFRSGPNSPEPGALCSGGIGTPE